MAVSENIQEKANGIRNERKARNVRENIASGLETMDSNINDFEDKINQDEQERITAEEARVTAESTRVSNETTRQSNEQTRQTNETVRQSSEQTRQNNWEQMQHVDANAELVAARQGATTLLENLEQKDNEIGNLTSLNTTAKDSTVNAINEVNSQLAESATNINDINNNKLPLKANESEVIKKGKVTRQEMDESQDSNLFDINDFNAATRATILNTRTKNLFNKQAVTNGCYVASGDGSLIAESNFSASALMEVTGGLTYTISQNTQQGVWLDINKQYISGWGTYGNTQSLVAPSNAKYMRITVLNTTLDTLQIEQGTSATDYVPFGTIANPSLGTGGVKRENIANGAVNSEKVDIDTIAIKEHGKNLFNKQAVTSGYYVASGDGGLITNSNFSASDFIEVIAGLPYTISQNTQQGAWYDLNKSYISGWGTYGNTQSLVAPSNAKYMRITILNTTLDTLQIEQSNYATVYEPFKMLVNFNNLWLPNPYKRIKSVMSSIVSATTSQPVHIKFLGDSITQGVDGTGFAQDGDLIASIYNDSMQWHVNTKGHCWANSLKDYLQSKFSCVVKNYGMTGAVTGFLELALDNGQLIDGSDDIIILMIGTNHRNKNGDSGENIYQFYSELDHLVKRILFYGEQVILMSSIPASIANETNDMAFHMEDVDNTIMAVAEANNMEYISVYKMFIEYCKTRNITIDSLLSDGLHPNDAGYDVMFYLICNALGIGTKRDGATW